MSKVDFGDFQTPLPLVDSVLAALQQDQVAYSRVLEPTCGRGHFITRLLSTPPIPSEIYGIERQAHYLTELTQQLPDTANVTLQQADVFTVNLKTDLHWQSQGPLLVIGNPPWVTSAQLGKLDSANIPPKSNFYGRAGIESITGSSNFDLAESIWLKLIHELHDQSPTVALLCKTSVARKILIYLIHQRIGVNRAWLRLIDAKQTFGVSVEAGLLCVELGDAPPPTSLAVFDDLKATHPSDHWLMDRSQKAIVHAQSRDVSFIEGEFPFQWRQGVKHDLAKVMELQRGVTGWYNGHGERVEIEADWIYPLLKCTDLFHGKVGLSHKSVVIPQHHPGEDTHLLQHRAPHLWQYLTDHRALFEARKSSIYRNAPSFAIFGVGDYSFERYKVGVSGLHPTPRFRVILPIAERPVIFDDTCYFVPCQTPYQAILIAELLNSPLAQRFFRAGVFAGDKRPITKKLLQRVNLTALFAHIERQLLFDQCDQSAIYLKLPLPYWADIWSELALKTSEPLQPTLF
jgi:hypothetical protein